MKVTAIKGFSDILPGEVETWQRVEREARNIFAAYNFAEIRIPILEKTELFSRSLGETTDIVEKEMYTFADQDAKGSLLTLRPSLCASGVVQDRAGAEALLSRTDVSPRATAKGSHASIPSNRRRSVRSGRSVYRCRSPIAFKRFLLCHRY